MSIPRVRGARDLRPDALAARRRAHDCLRDWFEANGFAGVDVPLLEPTDLYQRKAGELLTMLYSFTDAAGRRLSLRPEFTASVMRMYLDSVGAPFPVCRWHYAGPVFRTDPADRESVLESFQQGVEWINVAEPDSDAELVALAHGAARHLGVQVAATRVGHVGVFAEAIGGFRLSDRTQATILSGIGRLADGSGAEAIRERILDLGLMAETDDARTLKAALSAMGEHNARAVVRGLLDEMNVDLMGVRAPDEIVARLLRKMSRWDEPAEVERALELSLALARVRGAAHDSLAAVRRLLDDWNLEAPSLATFETTIDRVRRAGVEPLDVDFGLARDFSYYTGLVFELTTSRGPQPICGGGRYDGLARSLGGPDIPAVGFAFSLDRCVEAMR